MSVFQYFAIAIFTAICALILKNKNPDFSIILSIAGVIFIFIAGTTFISQIIDDINSVQILNEDLLEIPLKLLGLTILTNVTCAVCEDAGEKGLAVSTKTISKFACVGIAFPLFENLLEQIKVALSI